MKFVSIFREWDGKMSTDEIVDELSKNKTRRRN